jgi:predicted nucleotidyltransferase
MTSHQHEVVRNKRGEILTLAERYGATNVRVFGSVARDEVAIERNLREEFRASILRDAMAL